MLKSLAKLKLIHKGILIILVPLVFQCLVYVQLKSRMERVEKEARQQDCARKIQLQVNAVVMLSSSLFDTYVNGWISPSDIKQGELERKDERMRQELGKLCRLLDSDLGDRMAAAKVARLGDACSRELSNAQVLVKQTDEPMAVLLAVKHNRKLINCVRQLTGALVEVGDRQGAIVETYTESHEILNQQLAQYLDLVVVMNIVLAVGLMTFFMRGTARHLSILISNSKRLAERKILLPPIGEGDEIAEADRTFHEMADALIAADIKEKEMFDLLQVEKKRVESVIETMPIAVLAVGPGGQIELTNPGAEAMFEYSAEELKRKPFGCLFGKPKLIDSVALLEKWKSATVSRPAQVEGFTKSEEIVPLELSVCSFELLDGQGFLVTAIDVSERYKLERLKQEFVAMVSHDLRSPLMSIDANLELMKTVYEKHLTKEIKGHVDSAQMNAERLLAMVTRLLDLERLESGTFQFELSRFPAAKPVNDAWNSLRHLAEARGIQWKCLDSEISLKADSESIGQVVLNFLSNAIKFSPDNGLIECRIESENDCVVVSIIDQGQGIPEEELPHVFDKFRQSGSVAMKKKGTGLGLAICKLIVERHGGTIGAESEIGKGSRFWFKIPDAGSETFAEHAKVQDDNQHS